MTDQARQGRVISGNDGPGKGREGKGRRGKARQGQDRQGQTRRGKARQGKARQDKQGKASQDKLQGKTTRQDMVGQGQATDFNAWGVNKAWHCKETSKVRQDKAGKKG
jgi:hypothetical protein